MYVFFFSSCSKQLSFFISLTKLSYQTICFLTGLSYYSRGVSLMKFKWKKKKIRVMSSFRCIIYKPLIEFIIQLNFAMIVWNAILFVLFLIIFLMFVCIKFGHSFILFTWAIHFPCGYSYRFKFVYALHLFASYFFSFGFQIPVLSVMLLCYELSAQFLFFVFYISKVFSTLLFHFCFNFSKLYKFRVCV